MSYARIQIKRRSTQIVDGRKTDETLNPYYSCYAETRDLFGQELYDALNVKLENTIVFKVRYCKQIKSMKPHVKEFAIEYDGDIYDLYAMDFGNGDHAHVFLKANCTT